MDHNRHYWPVILEALPASPGRALDVGCGTGALSRELARRGWKVTAIDRDPPSIEAARSDHGAADIHYLLADFLAYPFQAASFDAITCVAALHHMDMSAALERMRDLVRPGGVLAILGLARGHGVADVARDVLGTVIDTAWDAGAATSRILRREPRRTDPVEAPTLWPPPMDWDAVRVTSSAMLPGVIYRRHVLWRYSLVWVNGVSPTD